MKTYNDINGECVTSKDAEESRFGEHACGFDCQSCKHCRQSEESEWHSVCDLLNDDNGQPLVVAWQDRCGTCCDAFDPAWRKATVSDLVRHRKGITLTELDDAFTTYDVNGEHSTIEFGVAVTVPSTTGSYKTIYATLAVPLDGGFADVYAYDSDIPEWLASEIERTVEERKITFAELDKAEWRFDPLCEEFASIHFTDELGLLYDIIARSDSVSNY